MLDKVWLILPSPDADAEWEPASVSANWELAVAKLKAETDGRTYDVQQTDDGVVVWVTDDMERYPVHIVAVPVETEAG